MQLSSLRKSRNPSRQHIHILRSIPKTTGMLFSFTQNISSTNHQKKQPKVSFFLKKSFEQFSERSAFRSAQKHFLITVTNLSVFPTICGIIFPFYFLFYILQICKPISIHEPIRCISVQNLTRLIPLLYTDFAIAPIPSA